MLICIPFQVSFVIKTLVPFEINLSVDAEKFIYLPLPTSKFVILYGNNITFF